MKRKNIITLIEKWDDFTKEQSTTSLENFALWLLKKDQVSEDRTNDERMAGYISARIDRFSKARIKQLFHDLPLIAYEDFILLNTVFHHPGIPKKELYERNVYDMNSGTQVINRLKREGLLTDTKSKEDKRVFTLNITEEGKRVRNVAFERLGEEVRKKYAILPDDSLNQFLITLKRLEQHLSTIA